ncbi:MAG: replication protein RepA [Clostridia bacterium]|nr:replication protein RepA [Clostridia bacterium]
MNGNEAYRSWFCVLNNPQETYTGEAQNIAEQVLSEWVENQPTRTGAVAYCISADGLIHLHMVLEDSNKARFSAIKKAYPRAHIEPTKGNKEQAEDYINKNGKFTEKGEKVIYIAKYGQIRGVQGQRKDLNIIEDYINEGKTPTWVMKQQLAFRKYEKLINDAYYQKRNDETPFLRDVKCVWHVGSSGTGKSYYANIIVKEKGEDFIYFVTDYDTGAFDKYNGQELLFLDEFRGQIKYSKLLAMLQGYKTQIYARYSNKLALWNEVHITSVLPPERVYTRMVEENKDLDTYEQLRRRLYSIIYHWKNDKGEYKSYEILAKEYKGLDDLKNRALGNEFETITDQMIIPFNEV